MVGGRVPPCGSQEAVDGGEGESWACKLLISLAIEANRSLARLRS